MKITSKKLRKLIREAILLEQPKKARILSTDPESQKVYSMKYPAQAVGRYAGHDSKGASDPEAQSAAKSAGVEIEGGKRGVGFTVIGNKHSLLEFDKAYRAATKPIRAKIEAEHGTWEERKDIAWAERTGRIPGKGLNDTTGKEGIGYDGAKAQMKAYAAGRGPAGAQVLETAFDEKWMAKYPVDFKTADEGMPSIKFAKKISDGPWPRK